MRTIKHTTKSDGVVQRHQSSYFISCILFLVSCILLTSCHGRRTYYEFQPVDLALWAMTDTLRFVPDAISEDGLYTVSAAVRFADNYPYRDLWLVVEQRTDGAVQAAQRDTLHMILADSRGYWLANGVVLHETEEVVKATRLTNDNPNEFLVYHIMSDQVLTGVSEVGLKIK